MSGGLRHQIRWGKKLAGNLASRSRVRGWRMTQARDKAKRNRPSFSEDSRALGFMAGLLAAAKRKLKIAP